jgi:hypothetical protein
MWCGDCFEKNFASLLYKNQELPKAFSKRTVVSNIQYWYTCNIRGKTVEETRPCHLCPSHLLPAPFCNFSADFDMSHSHAPVSLQQDDKFCSVYSGIYLSSYLNSITYNGSCFFVVAVWLQLFVFLLSWLPYGNLTHKSAIRLPPQNKV